MLIYNDTTQGPTLSPEIISEIIGYLHDDKKTLLTLGLVSKQTLYESRHHLFSAIDFVCNNPYVREEFDRFLGLVDVAWTSFTPTIHCINIHQAFIRSADDDSDGRDIPLARIRANLSNVKSLGLLTVDWDGAPSYIMDLVFQLPIEHLSLHWTYVSDMTALHNIFRRLPHSLKTLDFMEMRFTTMPDWPDLPDLSKEESSTFHRPFRFETLDSQSLLLFKSVWDPSICHNLDIKVKSFCLQSLYYRFRAHEHEAPFISRFLQRIGPSLENLTISLADLYMPGISSLLDPIHVSQCINLRSLEIGEIELENQAPDLANVTDVVRKFLSALPSPRDLQEISITVKPITLSLKDSLAMLEVFQWSSFVETVQHLFPNLHKLAIGIGIRDVRDFNAFFDLLRGVANLKELEEEGVIKLHVFYSPRKVSRTARRRGLV